MNTSIKNNAIKDYFMVISSNLLVLISNILTGLVIPKLLGVTNYGYYKIFTLYIGYTALLHFGFVDGILLLHGGADYDTLNKPKFRRNTRFFSYTQMFVSLIIVIFASVAMNGVYKYIFVAIGVDTIVINMTSYYQYVSQCTMRFKELSTRRVYQAGFRILFTVVFFLMHHAGIIEILSAQVYIGCLVFTDIILLGWYVFTYKDITFGKCDSIKLGISEFVCYYKTGLILTVAFQVANLILSLDRQFVLLLYDTETYGIYSFAYSLISMATTVIGAVSLVLFPNLKRKSETTIIADFSNSMAVIAILVFAAHIGYYPLCFFIKCFLPDYVQSLLYLKIIFPGLAISSCISTIIFTYYKVLNKNKIYFIISCFILLLSAILNWFSHVFFQSPEAISWASVMTLLIWYLISETYFIKHYHIRWIKNLTYIITTSICFYSVTFFVENNIIGTILYLVMYFVITILFYKKLIINNLHRFHKKV